MTNNERFTEILNRYLEKADRNHAWLGKRLGVDRSTVSRWANGGNVPRTPTLVLQIADELGIEGQDRNDFFRFAGAIPPDALLTTDSAPVGDTADDFSAEANIQPSLSNSDLPALPPKADTGSEVASAILPKRVQRVLPPSLWMGLGGAIAFALIILLSFSPSPQPLSTPQPPIPTTRLSHESQTPRSFAVMLAEESNASDEIRWSSEVRQALYQKLSPEIGFQGFFMDLPPALDQAHTQVDLWLLVDTQLTEDRIELSVTLVGPDRGYIATARAEESLAVLADGSQVCALDLYNRLAAETLRKLEVTIDAEHLFQMDGIPTRSCQALRANNGAVELVTGGHWQEAQPQLERALALDPNYADAYNNLGEVRRRQGELQAAEEAYQSAIRLRPAYPIYQYNLGLLYTDMGMHDEAIAAYQQALALDPAYMNAYNNLGFVYLQAGKLVEAETILNSGLGWYDTFGGDKDVGAYLYKNLGRLYLAQEDTTQASVALQMALDLYPNEAVFAEALHFLALAQHTTGETAAACATLGLYLQNAAADTDDIRAIRSALLMNEWSCPEEDAP